MNLFANFNNETTESSGVYHNRTTGSSSANIVRTGLKPEDLVPSSIQQHSSNPTPPAGGGNSPEDGSRRTGSIDGGESLGDGEINFDAFWTIPSSGLTPGVGAGPAAGIFDPNNIQGISDSSIPLYAMAEFGS
jgi:hypothetical protein